MLYKHHPGIAEVEMILQKEIKNNKSPMVQYRYFNQKEILYAYDNGYANLHTKIKADSNTTFNAYSLTKTFTAVAILQLAERGLLQIDQPVKQYLPLVQVWPDATIRQLLNHTAGIGNPLPLKWIHTEGEHAGFDSRKFFEKLLNKHTLRHHAPGKKIIYSNPGYVLAGWIIEAVTGLSYEQYVTENIIHQLPVNPQQLGFTVPLALLHANGYHNRYSISGWMLGLLLDKKKFTGTPAGKWLPFRPHYVNGAAYGGIIGTANSFVIFGQSLLQENSLLLTPVYKEMMFTEQSVASEKQTAMCLSWFTGICNGQDYRMHAGGGGGYYCELKLYPTLKTGSFIVFNRSGFSNERFLDTIDPVFLQ